METEQLLAVGMRRSLWASSRWILTHLTASHIGQSAAWSGRLLSAIPSLRIVAKPRYGSVAHLLQEGLEPLSRDEGRSIAVVAGGSAGIGAAVAELLADQGTDLLLAAREEAPLRAVAAELNSRFRARVMALQVDLSTSRGPQALIDAAVHEFGGLDILIWSAGGAQSGKLTDLPDAAWREGFELKLFGAVRAIRCALPVMTRRGGGRIVLLAGTAGISGRPDQVILGTINAAVIHLASMLAPEFAAHGITINAVAPGPTDTRRLEAALEQEAAGLNISVAEVREMTRRTVPTGRITSPMDVAHAVAFLASQSARQISGTTIVIDGGRTHSL